jgi:signal transduction histidine kinase/FixJ family two-component response regulator
MSLHKLLKRQLSKFISEEMQKDVAFQQFLAAVNDSYVSYERDKELLNHAFSISEKEYSDLLLNLNKEYELKKRSIDVLKQAVTNIRGEQQVLEAHTGSDDLLFIAAMLDEEVKQRNVIERKLQEAKRKAEESSRAKEAFLANMSHEIRTPLNAIVGMIRELSREKLTPSQMGYVEITETASQHLMSVLNNILDISKIEAGEFQLEPVHFNLQQLLRDVRSILLPRSEEKALTFNLKHPAATNLFLVGDAVRLRQILINLGGNAVKFTEKGEVTISYDVEASVQGKSYVNIIISDTGIGMDKAYLAKVFKKFSQEDVSISRKYGGSGLGMSITRELISIMEGNISIESQKNIGTTVTLRFLFPVGDPTKIINLKKPLDFKTKRTLSVLLVEDNAFNRMVAVNTLKKIDCSILEAGNGKEAIDALRKNPKIDIVLMDLQMPIMDGFEASRIIREEMGLTIPIIGLTANAFKSELEHCYAIGMDSVVVKPFEERDLIGTLMDQLGDSLMEEQAAEAPEGESTGLLSLARLRSLCLNNADNLRKMISLYIEVADKAIADLHAAHQQKDFFNVSQAVHKMKPSLMILDVKSTFEAISFLEHFKPEKEDTVRFEKEYQVFYRELIKVSAALKDIEI